jgi:hypothetical protein
MTAAELYDAVKAAGLTPLFTPQNPPAEQSAPPNFPQIPEQPEQSQAAPVKTPEPAITETKTKEIPQATKVAETVEIRPTEDGVSDEEILLRTVVLMQDGTTDAEVRAVLLKEFEDIQEDADEFIKKGRQQVAEEIETAQIAEDEARKTAIQATDNLLEAKAEADKHLVEKYQIAGRLGKTIDPNDKERAAKIIKDFEAKEAEPEDTFDDQAEEPFPECPIFPGALTDLARTLYPSLPLEFKQFGLIVRWGLMRSGLDRLEHEEHLQPRFYTVLVSPPNRGKTASINESRDSMKLITQIAKDQAAKANSVSPTPRIFADVENLPSADSGPFLVQEFFDVAKDANEKYLSSFCSDNRAKILLDPDELSDVFEKARTSNGRVSTLFIELLKLHSNNRTGSGTRQTGNRPVDNAHLAILAGTTVKKYPMLWTGTGGGADGLVSRFLAITTNAKQVPPTPLPSDFAAAKTTYDRLVRMAQLPGQTVQLSEDARTMLNDWWTSFDNGKESAARILETVKQLIIVLAVTNSPDDHTGTSLTVGAELMQHAIKFGEYEIAVRERLNPGDSWTHVQAMEQAIIRWAKKHASRKEPKSRNEFRRGVQPQRMPGGLGTFLIAWTNTVTSNVLKLRDQWGKSSRYSL